MDIYFPEHTVLFSFKALNWRFLSFLAISPCTSHTDWLIKVQLNLLSLISLVMIYRLGCLFWVPAALPTHIHWCCPPGAKEEVTYIKVYLWSPGRETPQKCISVRLRSFPGKEGKLCPLSGFRQTWWGPHSQQRVAQGLSKKVKEPLERLGFIF